MRYRVAHAVLIQVVDPRRLESPRLQSKIAFTHLGLACFQICPAKFWLPLGGASSLFFCSPPSISTHFIYTNRGSLLLDSRFF